MPQGPILGRLLFYTYMLLLAQIIQSTDADDKQLCVIESPGSYELIQLWRCHNFLQLKRNKTEVIIRDVGSGGN